MCFYLLKWIFYQSNLFKSKSFQSYACFMILGKCFKLKIKVKLEVGAQLNASGMNGVAAFTFSALIIYIYIKILREIFLN